MAIKLSFQPQLAFERALPLPLRTLLTLVELELVTGMLLRVMVRPWLLALY